MNVGRHENFPQALKNRTIVLGRALPYLDSGPISAVRVRCRILEQALRGAGPSSAASIARLGAALCAEQGALDRDFPALSDELEAYLPEVPARTAGDDAKTLQEFAVYSRMRPKLGSLAAVDEAGFLKVLLEVHRRLGTGANQLRSGPVWTRRDSTGNALLYPDARECPRLLGRLHGFIVDQGPDDPMLCAIAAYVALIHIHPFSDGNGRTARTVFNLLLGPALEFRHFVPLQTMMAQWRGAYIIKLRRAMYSGDLVPIADYFAALARISRRLQK